MKKYMKNKLLLGLVITFVLVSVSIINTTQVHAIDEVSIVDECSTDTLWINDLDFFKALIELDIDANDDKLITECEAQSFTGDLLLANRNIQSTYGLEQFINARSIDLSNNPIIILSLGQMPQLESLRLSNANISNLYFINYGDFRSLKVLDISYNDIDKTEFAAFAEFSEKEEDEFIYNLETLDVSGLEIEETNFLMNVRHGLKHLFISNNNINSIDVISDMYGLEYLDLEGNLISNLEGVGKLSLLELLDLSSNNVEDITELSKLSRLRILHLAYNYLDTREDISGNGIFGEDRVVIEEILANYIENEKTVYITYETQKPLIVLDYPTYKHELGEIWEDPEGSVFQGKNEVNWNDVVITGDEIDEDTLPGTYYIHYDFNDEYGNEARRVTRTVLVEDPGIDFEMFGEETYTLQIGDEWVEPGYIATLTADNVDITDQVIEHGFVSTDYPGTYVMKYIIETTYGTEYIYTRTIIVEAQEVQEPIDCAVTPEHEDCEPVVDCAATPEHEDCEPVVDCATTPEHEDCEQEATGCKASVGLASPVVSIIASFSAIAFIIIRFKK